MCKCLSQWGRKKILHRWDRLEGGAGNLAMAPLLFLQRMPRSGHLWEVEGLGERALRAFGVVSKKARPAVVSEDHKLASSLGNVYPHCFPWCVNPFPSFQFKIASRNADEGLSGSHRGSIPPVQSPFPPLQCSVHLSARGSIAEQVNKLGVTQERKMIAPETEFSGRITKQFGYISFWLSTNQCKRGNNKQKCFKGI